MRLLHRLVGVSAAGIVAACAACPAAVVPPPPRAPALPPASSAASLIANSLRSGPPRLALGRAHTCVRYDDGVVRCWGDNSRGQIAAPASRAPVRVPVLLPLGTAALLAAGGDRTCIVRKAIDPARQEPVVCMGAGIADDAHERVGPVGGGYNRGAVVVSDDAVCIATEAEYVGSYMACDPRGARFAALEWRGDATCRVGVPCAKRYGFAPALRGRQLCLLETSNAPGEFVGCSDAKLSIDLTSPAPIVGIVPREATQIALGGDFVCALGERGTTICWGRGVGVPSSERAAVVHHFGDMRAICATLDEVCGIESEGRVLCAERKTLRAEPVFLDFGVASELAATEIACGDHHACVVGASGRVWCWGNKDHAGLGDGPFAGASVEGLTVATPARVPPLW